MGPKKGKGKSTAESSKGKSTAESSSRLNMERFKDAESAESFKSRFINRTVIFERIVVQKDLANTGFMTWLRLNRILTLSNLSNECFEDWVREFYCNMFDVSESSFKTYVRGQTLLIDADKISTSLNIARPLRRVCPFAENDNIETIGNEVATALCVTPTIWDTPLLKTSGLTIDYRLLNTFVCHNIEPRGHKSDLQAHQAFLLYSLGTGNGVDIPQTIFESMLRVYNEPRQLALPFGAMICKMMIEAGCQAYSYELPVSKRQKIDARTMTMSDTHVRRRLRGEQPQVRADDAGEQPDDEEVDSIGNRLSSLEYAVCDQSIQIEQLEEKVAAGFYDIRNQLNTMFNQLRQQ